MLIMKMGIGLSRCCNIHDMIFFTMKELKNH